MLVLTRRIGEAIQINENIKVIFLGQQSKTQIKLGFEAPKEVNIVREEILKKRDINLNGDRDTFYNK